MTWKNAAGAEQETFSLLTSICSSCTIVYMQAAGGEHWSGVLPDESHTHYSSDWPAKA